MNLDNKKHPTEVRCLPKLLTELYHERNKNGSN
nr:MAG TPA: hypothetical protein [Caudoviricetes sp.]